MRFIVRLVAIATLLFVGYSAKANHVLGGNLTWDCLGGNQYTITLRIYKDCFGASPALSAENLFIYPTGCASFPQNITLNLTSTTEISNLCPSELSSSSCNGGLTPGTQLLVYQATVTLDPGCTWEVIWNEGDWNYFNNITYTSLPDAYVSALINTAYCVDSPVITSMQVPYQCRNTGVFTHVPTLTLPAGVTASYAISTPQTTGASIDASINVPGYVNTLGATVNAATGAVSINTNGVAVGNYIVTIEITLTQGGNVIGTFYENMVFVIRDCATTPTAFANPEIQSINIPAIQGGPATINACVGDAVCFTVSASNANLYRAITITSTWTAGLNIGTPVFTQSTVNYNPASGTFCFTADASMIGTPQTITFNAIDNACTAPQSDVQTVTVNVFPSIILTPVTATICANTPLTATAVGGSTYTWSVLSGDATPGFDGNAATQILESISSNTVIVATIPGVPAQCDASDTLTVTVTSFTAQPTTTQTMCVGGTSTALSFTIINTSGTLTYQWYSSPTNTNTGGTLIAGATAATYTPPTTTAGTLYYYCVISMSSGACPSIATNAAEVIVVADPTISTQPTATQSICVGGTPTALSVAYTNGLGTATYQWYSNATNSNVGGTIIAGATAATYTPPVLNVAGTFNYYCVVSLNGSGCGTASSAVAQVVVVADPTITAQPLNTQTLCLGATPTTLSVTGANGTGGLTYQWYSNTVNNNTTGTIIAGATNSTYVPPTNVAGTRYYYCRVTANGSGCGIATSTTATVIVNALPTISTQPTATQSICIGGTPAALTVAYTGGAGTASYQWYSNTTNSNTGGTLIPGATTASYTGSGAVIGTYYFYCVVTLTGNGCGSVTSAVAQIIVVADPVVSTQPTATQTICAGGTPTALTMALTGGAGTVLYQWYSNTTPATTGGLSITGATLATYTPPTLNTAGNYYYYGLAAVFGSGCGTATSNSANVIVVADPSVGTQPLATQSICVGGTPTTLSVTPAGGTGTFSYQWYSNTTNSTTGGTLITGATNTSFSPPAPTGLGTTYYYCTVSANGSGCGTGTSATAAVVGIAAPTVSTQPTVTQTICDGGNSSALTVAYTGGAGTPSYQWYSNTTNSNSGGTLIAGATAVNYTATSLTAGTYYYYCVISLTGAGCNSLTSNAATVVVIPDQTITTQPTATQTICVGGTPSALTLAYTGGTGTATYQWYNSATNATTGGAIIAGATSATYTPPAINTAGNNYYYGVATLSGSGCGSATSASAEVVVIADPTITTQPLTTQTVCAGGTATALTVVSTGGTGTTTYQWYSNAANNTTSGTLIAGATTDTYTPAATAAGTTYYYNIATISGSGCGTATSATGTVIVVTAPTITTQPLTTQTVCQNGATTPLTLGYSNGTGTATYQWYSNTTNNTATGTPVAGETNVSFTPPSATVGTTYYYAIATLSGSGCGTVTTASAAVVVNALPTITTQPTATQTICVGGTPSALTLAYTGGTGTATYQWYNSATNATTGGAIIAGATSATYTPPAINTAGNNYYYGVATLSGSGCGSATSASAEVVVIADPTITTQPLTTQTVCAGGTATALTVVSTGGTGTTTYQWYSNAANNTTSGTLIAGATTDTYTPAATAAGTTYYYNIATISGSGCGTATSATGTVIVVTAPTITTQPLTTQTVCQNGATTPLTLGYSNGTGTATYQWYSNTTNNTATGTPVAGETNVSFTPPSATVGTTYYYAITTLSGSGCGTATTNVATVNVLAPPTITTEPTATQTICVGGTPSALTLAYTGGTGTATYQWYNSATNATTGGAIIAGATSATYTPPAINTAGNNYYYGVATLSGSGCGSATSASAEVVVIADPTITTQPLTTQTVCAGGTATALTVVSTGGTGTTTYQWYSNAANNTTSGTLIAGATTDTYTPAATAAGTTYYYNIATISGSGCGTATSATGTVIVVTAPTITTQPLTTQTVCQNGATTPLTLAYSNGTGTATYQWYSNTTNNTATGTPVAGETNVSFTPPSATVGTTYYYAIATLSGSGCGTVTTASAAVIVNALPTITTQPTATQTICVGGTPSALTLAYTGGTGTATYQWYNSATNATTGGAIIAGATSATYTPPAINTAGNNYYYGVATLSGSGCGSATSASAEVVVIADPTITTQPLTTQTVCAGGTATALTIVSTGGTGTTTYQWYSNAANNTTSGTLIAGATTDTYTPAATAAGTTYYYNIATISGSGCGTATSATGTVIVVTAPTITTQPLTTQTVCQNGATTPLTLGYSNGTGTATYQWYSNTTNNTATGTPVAGETNVSFTPPSATVGTTYYYAIATLSGSGCGTVTTASAAVIVNALPTITTQPTATQTICVGGTPSALTLAYTGGTGTATYQWYNSATNATTGGAIIAGATSATYTPPAINTAGNNYYYGVATLSGSGCGTATSAAAEVIAVADPSITVQPLTTQTVCQNGLSTPLTVTVTGGTGTTTYQWYTNPINSNVGGIASGNAATLTPITAVVGTAYVYCVINTTGVGCTSSASTTAAVIVVPIPTVTTQPLATQTVCQNGATTPLTLAYSNGTGTATYQWYSNTTNNTATGTPVAGETNVSFTPPSATVGTTYYYAIATLSGSGCGTVTTASAAVIVNALPTITTQPTATQTICVGGTPSALTLAYTGGTGTATYQWYNSATNATTGGAIIAGATSATYTPPAINTAGNNYYYGVATLSGSGCGSATSASAEVVVIADPTITTQPLTTQTVCAGGTATALTIVSTGGTGTTTYQWYSNAANNTTSGTLIAGATTDTYTPAATAAGTTYYYNIATISGSGCGTATSATGTVIVVTAPTITTQPLTTQTVCQNGATTPLTLGYSNGTGTATYQWYSNTTNNTATGTPVAGETNVSFTPPSATVGTTYYYAIATLSGSGCGTVTTASAAVIVNALPTITTQPTATQTICVGGTPSALTLAYTGGTGTATYQWYNSATNATTGGAIIAGATSATYTPPAINTAGNNYYYGVATLSGSGCGTATSAAAEVIAVADPSITVQPLTTQTVCQNGLSTPLTVTVTGGTGTTTYQWYTNPINSNVGGIASGNAATLTPITAVVGTAYVYCVINTTGVGCTSSASTTAAVIVVPIPTVTTQPLATQTVCQNGATTPLTLAYSNGTGTATYQWYSNTTNNTATGTPVAGETNVSFTPPSATVGTTYYYAIATLSGSGCGTVTTASAAVIVNALPTITTQPTATQTICVGGTPSALTLAYTGGTGTATYQWYNSATNATTGGAIIAGATSATYTPPAINTAGNNYYYGVATLSGSGCGSATSASAEVVVIADPTITTQPLTTQTVCAGGTATALTIVSTGGTGTTTYQWYSNAANNTTSGTLIAGATTDTYTPAATAAGTTYYYNIATISGSGCGTATSATGTVIVVTAPTITTQPLTTQTVCQNGATTPLTLGYSNGTGTATYQWYSNTTNNTATGTPVAGETNVSFTPPSATVGTTYYYAIATLSGSGCGTVTTASAAVVVNALPTITTQPTATQTICEGGIPSALTLAYTGGTGNATYQWYSNTTNTTTGGAAIVGSTSATFTPPVLNTAGTYYYYGEATLSGSGCGTATSAAAEVIAVADPSITVQPLTTQTVCQNGLSTPLTVTVTGGTGTTTYQWYTNPINSNVGGIASGNAATLTPITAVVGTAYVYCVINTTGVGCTSSASTTAAVIVVPIPTVTTQPLATQTVCQNGATTPLTLGYSNGTGTATYQWYSNTTNNTTTGTPVAGETNVSFTPPSVTVGTTYYYAIATLSGSGCGTITTASSEVVVVGLPTITGQPTVAQNVCEGGTANPIAVAYAGGTGIATYQWFSNNTNTSTGGVAIAGETSNQYTIPTQTTAGNYFYYVEVTLDGSGCGTIASASSEVVVFLDPSVATEPLTTQSLCVNGAPTDLQVTFNDGAGTASYQWYLNTTNSNTGGTLLPSATNATYTPSTVNPGTQYFYCQIALTGSGCATATSAAAEVIVVGLPTVSLQAIPNETVCLDGTPSTLSPGILGGTGAVSYQWYSNTINDTTTGFPIAGETNATYSPVANAVGATYYYLTTTFAGTNCGSVTTNSSQIIVVADPTLTTQPIATDSLCVGGTPATLSVASTGGVGTPSYQWYVNTVNSNTGGTAVVGAGQSTYAPATTTVVGSEFYYAEITLSGSGCDVIASSVSEIVNVADPVISTQPLTTQNECLDAPTTALNAAVSGGLGTASYAWYFNSSPIAPGTAYPGATTTSVLPANAPVGITYYYMVATLTGNGCDPAVSNFSEVIVNALPNITVTPVQDSICFGATTDVFASGAVNYVWTADPTITSATNVAIVTVAPVGSVSYSVQGTDALGCISNASGTVFAADALSVQEGIATNICYETCTGGINLTPTGGIPNYTVDWTDPTILGLTPTNLCPGTYDYTVTDNLGCTFQNAITITSLPNNPLDNVIITPPVCFGFTNGSIEFQDPSSISFELINAATTATIATQATGLFSGLGAGDYNVIYQDALGCIYDSLNFSIVEQSAQVLMTLNAASPVSCFNEIVPLTANAGGGNGGPLTITWGTCPTVTNCILGIGNPFDYTVTSDMTIYAQASDPNGCTSTIQSIVLNLADPIAVQMQNGISSVSICEGECVNMTAAASGGTNPITIEWYEVPTAIGGTTIGPNGTSNTYCPTNTTSVYVYANDGCAFPASDTLNITVFPLPNVGFTVSDQNGCAPVTVSFTNTTSPALSANCIWTMDDGTTIPICGNQVYTYTEVGTYSPSLYVISADGCSATYTIPAPIEVYGYPTAEFTWAPEPADVLNPIVNFSNGSTDAVGYYWDFGPYGASIDVNPIFTFPDEDLAEFPVCLTASNEFGCTDTACHTVTMNSVLQVWVPNAFTPEQDGLNEIFLPIIKGAKPDGYHFMIFDRWGTLIFESFDIGEPWIGDIRGGNGFAQDGTYVWRLEVQPLADRSLKVFTGFVTVLR